MQTDLMDLLASRDIGHPSVLTSANISPGELRLSITGFPWWKGRDGEETITFVLTGVEDGEFYPEDILPSAAGLDSNTEWLEEFSIARVADVEWLKRPAMKIHGYGPVPEPLKLFAVLHDFLVSLGASKQPGDFLNMGRGWSIGEFERIVETGGYLLARAPERIGQVLCNELERQGVSFKAVRKDAPEDNRLVVRFGRSFVLCQTRRRSLPESIYYRLIPESLQ